jgi:hypothetical protein
MEILVQRRPLVHCCPANDRTTARMSLIIRWLCGIRSGNDLNCESSVALIRKGLRTDGARKNPNSYTFSQHAVTYGSPVFIEFRSVLVP